MDVSSAATHNAYVHSVRSKALVQYISNPIHFKDTAKALCLVSDTGRFIDIRVTDPQLLVAPIEEIIGTDLTKFVPSDITHLWGNLIDSALSRRVVKPCDYQLKVAGGLMHFVNLIVPAGPRHVAMAINPIPLDSDGTEEQS